MKILSEASQIGPSPATDVGSGTPSASYPADPDIQPNSLSVLLAHMHHLTIHPEALSDLLSHFSAVLLVNRYLFPIHPTGCSLPIFFLPVESIPYPTHTLPDR